MSSKKQRIAQVALNTIPTTASVEFNDKIYVRGFDIGFSKEYLWVLKPLTSYHYSPRAKSQKAINMMYTQRGKG